MQNLCRVGRLRCSQTFLKTCGCRIKANRKGLSGKQLSRPQRQSSQLRSHGGKIVEELAIKRKQVQNLEVPCNKSLNSFAVLNNLEDDYFVKTAKELEIELASDEEGCRAQITTIKAEELLRADIAKASYQAYLHNMKIKDGAQDDEVLDLNVIDNKHRGFSSTSDSNLEGGSKEKRNQNGVKKKKK
jgi:hypothetical protein